MISDIVSVEIGRSTWQGPAEEAPGRAGNRDADERYGRAAGQQVRALVANLSVWAGKAHPDQQLVDLAHVLAILDSNPAALTPAPQPEMRLATREELLAGEILAELTRARAKFPGKNVTFAALVEEVGELATATFEESADRVRKEAVQVAVMAMRMILDGDHCYEPWRAEKGLDPLDPALREMEGRDHG